MREKRVSELWGLSMTNSASAISEVRALSRRALLIVWLQGFTQRNLTSEPPGDAEKLVSNLGVGATSLDRFVRPWVNQQFRVPDNKTRLAPGTLDATVTFKQLRDYANA